MPYQLVWRLPNAVLEVTYSGVLSVDDINQAARDIVAALDTATQRVYLMSDTTHIHEVAFTAKELVNSAEIAAVSHHDHFAMALYFDNQNPFVNFLITLIGKHGTDRRRIYHNRHAAVEFLARQGFVCEDEPE